MPTTFEGPNADILARVAKMLAVGMADVNLCGTRTAYGPSDSHVFLLDPDHLRTPSEIRALDHITTGVNEEATRTADDMIRSYIPRDGIRDVEHGWLITHRTDYND